MEREVFRRVREALKEFTVPELVRIHNIIHDLGIFSDSVGNESSYRIAYDLVDMMKEACGVDVTSPSRRTIVKLCRWCVVEDLMDLKYSLTSIGRVINKDHSTITYYTSVIRSIKAHPTMYPDYYEIKAKYQAIKDKYGYNSLQDLGKGPDADLRREIQTEKV